MEVFRFTEVARIAQGSPYVQDGWTQNVVQGAGLIGQGWPFGRPYFFSKNATEKRGGAA